MTFEFKNGDELKISESGHESYAVIQFNGLRFISCSSGKKLLINFRGNLIFLSKIE